MQGVSKRRALSTADYKRVTLYSAVGEALRVEMTCIIFLIVATCVACKRFFAAHLERSMSLYQIMAASTFLPLFMYTSHMFSSLVNSVTFTLLLG